MCVCVPKNDAIFPRHPSFILFTSRAHRTNYFFIFLAVRIFIFVYARYHFVYRNVYFQLKCRGNEILSVCYTMRHPTEGQKCVAAAYRTIFYIAFILPCIPTMSSIKFCRRENELLCASP